MDAVALTPNNAWAVGYFASGKNEWPLVLHWDGRSWTRTPSASLPADSKLFAIAAASARDVWAVGQTNLQPLALHWDGTGWNEVALPAPAAPAGAASSDDGTSLHAVAFSGRTVLAAGAQSERTASGVRERAYTVRWLGSRWRHDVAAEHRWRSGFSGLAAARRGVVWAISADRLVRWQEGGWRGEFETPKAVSRKAEEGLTQFDAISPRSLWVEGSHYDNSSGAGRTLLFQVTCGS